MQKVLSTDLWKSIRAQARHSRERRAAIAYVTRDLIGFRQGDVLVVNASTHAIACGETSARLLRTLHRKRVRLYDCADLHAKVLLLDNLAVISSGNMSTSSSEALVEAAVLTDHLTSVSGVASLIEQLIQQSKELTLSQIDRLCRIKVIRRGGWSPGDSHPKIRVARLGNRTWLVGVRELVRDPIPAEQKMIAKAEAALRPRLNSTRDELDWIRWGGKGRFIRECREGDLIIRIWRSSRARRPSSVVRAQPVLLKQKMKNWTRFYLPPRSGTQAEMSWGRFQKLLKSLGYARRVGPTIEHLLESDLADDIDRRWSSASKG